MDRGGKVYTEIGDPNEELSLGRSIKCRLCELKVVVAQADDNLSLNADVSCI